MTFRLQEFMITQHAKDEESWLLSRGLETKGS